MSVNMTEEVQSDEVFKKLDALKDIRWGTIFYILVAKVRPRWSVRAVTCLSHDSSLIVWSRRFTRRLSIVFVTSSLLKPRSVFLDVPLGHPPAICCCLYGHAIDFSRCLTTWWTMDKLVCRWLDRLPVAHKITPVNTTISYHNILRNYLSLGRPQKNSFERCFSYGISYWTVKLFLINIQNNFMKIRYI